MSQEAVFDVVFAEWFFEEGVLTQIDHARCKVIAGAPEGMHVMEFIGAEGGTGNGGAGWPKGADGGGFDSWFLRSCYHNVL